MSVIAIRSYIRQNPGRYAEYYSDLVESFLFMSNLRYTVAVALILSNISNFTRTHDPLNLIVNIPSVILLLTYPVLRQKQIIPQGKGTHVCFLLILLLALQWSFSFWVFVKNDAQLIGPTVVTITMSVLWVFSLGPSILVNLLKASTATFVFLGLMYLIAPEYVASIKGSLITGMLLGIGLNQSMDQMLRFRFYIEEQQKLLLEKNAKIELIIRASRIMMFSMDMRWQLHSEFTADFARLFGDSSAIVHLDGLLSLSDISPADKTAMQAALQAILGENELTFAMNDHALIKKFHLQTVGEGWRTMLASYAPLIDGEGRVKEILLAINDVTDMEHQESRQKMASMEAESLLVLLRAPREQIELFMGESQRILRIIGSRQGWGDLLRVLHTLKGNARTLGFKGLSQLIHEAEGSIQSGTGFDDGLHSIQAVLNLLLSVYHDRFQVPQEATHLTDFLEQLLQKSAEQLCHSLQKPVPIIHVNCTTMPDTGELRQQMFQVIPHLLANALDHGIEPADERLARGKTARGNILCEYTDGDFVFRDDGRGLNLTALRDHLARLHPGRAFSDQEVALSIFTLQHSTKRKISEISGRGVGMSAVAEVVKHKNGKLSIRLGEKTEPDYRSFSIVWHL